MSRRHSNSIISHQGYLSLLWFSSQHNLTTDKLCDGYPYWTFTLPNNTSNGYTNITLLRANDVMGIPMGHLPGHQIKLIIHQIDTPTNETKAL